MSNFRRALMKTLNAINPWKKLCDFTMDSTKRDQLTVDGDSAYSIVTKQPYHYVGDFKIDWSDIESTARTKGMSLYLYNWAFGYDVQIGFSQSYVPSDTQYERTVSLWCVPAQAKTNIKAVASFDDKTELYNSGVVSIYAKNIKYFSCKTPVLKTYDDITGEQTDYMGEQIRISMGALPLSTNQRYFIHFKYSITVSAMDSGNLVFAQRSYGILPNSVNYLYKSAIGTYTGAYDYVAVQKDAESVTNYGWQMAIGNNLKTATMSFTYNITEIRVMDIVDDELLTSFNVQ